MDVRDLGGHLDSTRRGWSSTLSTRVLLVISRFVLKFVVPLEFHGHVQAVRSLFIPCALHGVESSKGSFLKLRPGSSLLANAGAWPPCLCMVWFWFRLFRRFLSYRPEEVCRLYRLLDMVHDGGHGPVHALVASARRIGFRWNLAGACWDRPG